MDGHETRMSSIPADEIERYRDAVAAKEGRVLSFEEAERELAATLPEIHEDDLPTIIPENAPPPRELEAPPPVETWTIRAVRKDVLGALIGLALMLAWLFLSAPTKEAWEFLGRVLDNLC
jgi:hypothetical protein